MPRPHHRLAVCAATLLAGATAARAQEVTTLDRVQVTATRVPHATADAPAAISVVAVDDEPRDVLGANGSELLSAVPGVLARTRQNFAQDEQLSIRGFGTRASFGIRGVRLYVDGIPATMPDGQGQLSHFPLMDADRIEVLRGPFSALYGNAAGGVLQLFTVDGARPRELQLEAAGGSDANRRISTRLRDARDGFDYVLGLNHFATEGARAHSRAERSLVDAKANLAWPRTRLTLVANALWAPNAQDPLGLDRSQFDTDPHQVSEAAIRFDTRKSVTQRQLGATLAHELAHGGQLRLLAYAGQRDTTQFLAIPVATQANPLSGGGVIDLAAPYAGVDARWTRSGILAGRPFEIVAGASFDGQRQDRRGYENFIGTELGVRGALRLSQDDDVRAFDPYAQASWRAADDWTLMAGVRRSDLRFRSRDRYVTAGNPDDSGAVRYRATSPVAGIGWNPSPRWHWFAAWGRGFETPTFNELAYRSDGGSGPNFALQPARTRSIEAGFKFRGAEATSEFVLFRADTRDELTVATSSGGRTTFQNAGDARRRGLEWSARVAFAARWRAEVAATWLDARFRDGFLACAATPCPVADVPVPAGTRVPGVPRTSAYAALQWGGDTGWHARAEVQHVGAVPVNNVDGERAPAYAALGASAGYGVRGRGGDGRAFFAVGNLLDHRHAGSVIVNEGNRRYYEPAAGRSVTLGLEWRWRGERPGAP